MDFPKLSPEARRRLMESIARRGPIIPIVENEEGTLIDGVERHAIGQELGLPLQKIIVGNCTTPEQIADLRRELNSCRRRFSRAEARQAIAEEIEANPDASDRAVSRAVGPCATTVGKVRKAMAVPSGHYPRVLAETEAQAREAKRRLADLGEAAPAGPVRIRKLRNLTWQLERDRKIAQGPAGEPSRGLRFVRRRLPLGRRTDQARLAGSRCGRPLAQDDESRRSRQRPRPATCPFESQSQKVASRRLIRYSPRPRFFPRPKSLRRKAPNLGRSTK
jgi:hypothetical protein